MASHAGSQSLSKFSTGSPLGNSFTTNEVEFLAEEELIQIVPRFRSSKLNLIRGNFGPFRPQVPATVPLWLAVALKKQRKCNIQAPTWMNVDFLKQLKQLEKESEMENLQPLPIHYMEFASILLQYAADDIPNVETIRSLLEDVENLRQHKIRQGLQRVGEQEEALHMIKLNNASAMELHSIRPILLSTLHEFFKLHAQAQRTETDLFGTQDTYDSRLTSSVSDNRSRLQAYPSASQSQDTGEQPGTSRLRRYRGV